MNVVIPEKPPSVFYFFEFKNVVQYFGKQECSLEGPFWIHNQPMMILTSSEG